MARALPDIVLHILGRSQSAYAFPPLSCYVYIPIPSFSSKFAVYLCSIPPTPLPETKCPHRQKPGPARGSANCRKSRTLRPFSFLFSLNQEIESDEEQFAFNPSIWYTNCQAKRKQSADQTQPDLHVGSAHAASAPLGHRVFVIAPRNPLVPFLLFFSFSSSLP